VGPGQPPALINALAQRVHEFTQGELLTVVDVYPTAFHNSSRSENFVLDYSYCIVQRKGLQEGKYVYTPGRLGDVPHWPNSGRSFNVVMCQVAPMDKHGYFSLGTSCDYVLPWSKTAEIVLVQVNEKMPRTFGRNFIHVSEVTAIVEETVPLATLPSVPPNENEQIIGQYIADLVEDGACIQLGIGGIPNAVGLALETKKNLGVHTEMIADSIRILWEKGVVNNRAKNFMPDIMVATFALGPQELYDWLDNNPMVHFYPTDFVNDPFIIAQNDKMISINSTLEIDLSGQACSESIGHVPYTHTGGQADFVFGAGRSLGGKSVLAFESTYMTKEGLKSRIVPHLKLGSFVTTARYDIQYCATEYGVVNLKAQTLWERVRRLVSIAHPDFRDQLLFDARKANFI
jgi:acyl-CoA hydrolase